MFWTDGLACIGTRIKLWLYISGIECRRWTEIRYSIYELMRLQCSEDPASHIGTTLNEKMHKYSITWTLELVSLKEDPSRDDLMKYGSHHSLVISRDTRVIDSQPLYSSSCCCCCCLRSSFFTILNSCPLIDLSDCMSMYSVSDRTVCLQSRMTR